MRIFDLVTQKMIRKRAEKIIRRVQPFLAKSQKIIDIGSGTGGISLLLQRQGKDVTPVDVADFYGPRLVEPIIYDGKKLPFPDMAFDTALVLMVLHHTSEPELVFSEAARVAREITIIETSFSNNLHKLFTVVADAFGNRRLGAYWSSYRTDEQWQQLFRSGGFKIVTTRKYQDTSFGVPFLHILYYLTRS